jgi:hypothetical protein
MFCMLQQDDVGLLLLRRISGSQTMQQHVVVSARLHCGCTRSKQQQRRLSLCWFLAHLSTSHNQPLQLLLSTEASTCCVTIHGRMHDQSAAVQMWLVGVRSLAAADHPPATATPEICLDSTGALLPTECCLRALDCCCSCCMLFQLFGAISVKRWRGQLQQRTYT